MQSQNNAAYPATFSAYDILMKVIVIGDSGVGKSSLLHRYMDNDYCPTYVATIGVDFKIDTFETSGKVVKLQMWDTAGHERFRSIASAYYRSAHCVLLCYDTTDRESFEHVRDWVKDVRTYGSDDVPMALIGTKADLPEKREVTTAEAQAYAEELGARLYETSARDPAGGVHKAVRAAVMEALEYRLDSMTVETEKRQSLLDQMRKKENAKERTCLHRFKMLLGI